MAHMYSTTSNTSQVMVPIAWSVVSYDLSYMNKDRVRGCHEGGIITKERPFLLCKELLRNILALKNVTQHTSHKYLLIWLNEIMMLVHIEFGLWEKARVGWFERIALKHVHYHMWNRWAVQVQCMKPGTQSQCSGTTQRDGMGRAVGEGFGTGRRMYGKNHYNIVK